MRHRIGETWRTRRSAAAAAMLLLWASHAAAVPILPSPFGALNTDAVSDTGEDTAPRLATDGAGTWMAVWRTTNPPGGAFDPNIVFARSTDGGATWTPPAILDSTAPSASSNNTFPRLAASPSGTWIAAWNSPNTLGGTIGFDLDVLFVRSTDAGATWSPTAALNANAASDAGDDGFVHLATDGAGTWVAVWESDDTLGDTTGSDDDVLVARSIDDGVTWSPPAALNTNAAADAGTDSFPSVATDGAGTWVAVWMSTDPLGGPPKADFDVLVARSVDAGITWSAPAPIAGAGATPGFDGSPVVAVDAAGDWLVAWHSTIPPDTEILAVRSTDGGVTWTDAVAASPGGANTRPALTTPRAGLWLAAWERFDPVAVQIDVVLATSADGGATWSRPVRAAADASAGIEADVAIDAAGAFVAVWYGNVQLGGNDDQDVFTSHGLVLPLDDFRCYGAKPTRGSPKFARVPGLALVDPAAPETLTVDAKKPRHLCAPAGSTAGAVADAGTHLESYDVAIAKKTPKLVQRVDVRVASALGELRLDTLKAVHLFVPTAKDHAADPAPPDPAEIALDPYRCDKVKLTKGAPKFPKGLRVTVADQFSGAPRLVELKKPRLLCTPVEVGGATLRTPAARFLCFPGKQVKAVCAAGSPVGAGSFCTRETDCGGTKGATSFCAKQPKHQRVLDLHVANDLGTGRLDARQDQMVCLPAVTTP